MTIPQQSPQPNTPHQGVWVLVIVLIILTLGLSVTVIWMAIASSAQWGGSDVGIPLGSTPAADDADDASDATDDEAVAPSEDSDDASSTSNATDTAPSSTVGAAFTRELPATTGGAMPNVTPIYNTFQAGPVTAADDCQNAFSADDGNGADPLRYQQLLDLSFAPSSVQFEKSIKNRVERYAPEWGRICRAGEADVYVLLVTDPDTLLLAFPYRWDAGDNELRDYQPIHDVFDSSANLFTGLVPGHAMVMRAYGDAGVLSWSYYLLNDAYRTTELIEQCSMVQHLDSRGGNEVVSQTLSCSVWYNGEVN